MILHDLTRCIQIQRRWQLARAERATTLSSLPKKVKYVGRSPPSRRILASPENQCQRDVKAPVKDSIPPPARQDLQSPVRAQRMASPVYTQQMTSPVYAQQMDSPVCAQQMASPVHTQQMASPVHAQQMISLVRAQQMASPSMPQGLLNYPAPCTTCTFRPPISSYHSKRLRKFFADAEDLIPILNYIGILHDRQLRMVLNWSPADRVTFINSLSSDQVKPADRQRLVTLLTNRPSASCSNSVKSLVRPPHRSRRERPYDPIPKPPPDVEQHLTSPDTPLYELMQATTVQNAQEFEEILVSSSYRYFLSLLLIFYGSVTLSQQAIDRIYGECEHTSSDKDNQWWIQFFQAVRAPGVIVCRLN